MDAVRPADVDGRCVVAVIVILLDPGPAVPLGVNMGTNLIFHRVDGGIGQQNAGLQVEHPHGAVYGIDGQRGIIRIGIVEILLFAGEQVVEQIPPRHFRGGGIRLRDRHAGRIIPDGLVIFAEHSALLRADQIHQLISAVVVQADHACTGVLLVTGQLLAGGGVVQAVGTRRAILVVVAHHQPVGGGGAVAAAGIEAGKAGQLCLIDHLALPILHLHGAVGGQIIAPFVFLHIVCRDIADFKGQIAACYAASVGVFGHSQLLARGKVDHPAIACGVVVAGGIGHLFRCGQDQQAAGQDGIVGTVKSQNLLAAAVAQGGCPPGGGAGG